MASTTRRGRRHYQNALRQRSRRGRSRLPRQYRAHAGLSLQQHKRRADSASNRLRCCSGSKERMELSSPGRYALFVLLMRAVLIWIADYTRFRACSASRTRRDRSFADFMGRRSWILVGRNRPLREETERRRPKSADTTTASGESFGRILGQVILSHELMIDLEHGRTNGVRATTAM